MTRIPSESIPETIDALLELRCALTPEKSAFFRYDEAARRNWLSINWGEIGAQTAQFAIALRRAGVEPGARVAIALRLNTLWYPLANAVYRNRAVVVSLDTAAGAGEIAAVLRHCSAAVLITDRHQWQELQSVSAVQPWGTILVDDAERSGDNGVQCLQRLLAESSGHVERSAPLPPTGSDLATIVYTSGTTGAAKGIAYRHEQVMVACRALAAAYPELGPEDRTICWLPLSAMFQRMANLLSMVCAMRTYFVADPRSILQQLACIKPTFFIGVPRFYEKLDEASQAEPTLFAEAFHAAKLMISGSAPIPMGLLQSLQARGVPVREAYGLSENTVPVACNRLAEYRFGSVGKPLPPNEVKLSADGEVCVRGPGVFEGYLGDRPSEALFTGDGFYRTGDLGRFDEDGFLYLIGRKRDLIKTSTGRRIGPSGIEAVYARCPSIDQVLVVGDGRKYLAALVTLSHETLSRLSSESGSVSVETGGTACCDKTYAKELLDQWLAAGESLPAEHRIEAFGILLRPFAGDEITSSQKLKRSVIVERHTELINQIYQHSTPCIVVQANDCDTLTGAVQGGQA